MDGGGRYNNNAEMVDGLTCSGKQQQRGGLAPPQQEGVAPHEYAPSFLQEIFVLTVLPQLLQEPQQLFLVDVNACSIFLHVKLVW